jgi:hypothetical protein
MKALIDPTTTNIQYISSYIGTPPKPVYSTYPNSARVAQVEPDADIFPVADPYYWIDCPDNCVEDYWYCDTANQTVNPIVNAPIPAANDQPTIDGLQTA